MEFTDKRGRKIFLEESNNIIDAYCIDEDVEEKVGYIQFQVTEYSSSYMESVSVAYPEQMHIKPQYQRSGIATQIIEYAKRIYDTVKFSQDTGCGGNTDEIHYSSEGLQFKQHCEGNGITECICDYEEEECIYDYEEIEY